MVFRFFHSRSKWRTATGEAEASLVEMEQELNDTKYQFEITREENELKLANLRESYQQSLRAAQAPASRFVSAMTNPAWNTVPDCK